MKEFTKNDNYLYSVLDVCRDLSGHITGSSGVLLVEELYDRIDWLRWRISEGWKEVSKTAPISWQLYDNSVKNLALSVLSMYEEY